MRAITTTRAITLMVMVSSHDKVSVDGSN